jgi:hypothetical protein
MDHCHVCLFHQELARQRHDQLLREASIMYAAKPPVSEEPQQRRRLWTFVPLLRRPAHADL